MISVAIATYNGENYLQPQLNSILNQSMLPTEVVIVDDSSNDRTWQLICEFANIAPFNVIKLKNESNLGYAKNFSIALSKCTSDVIFFCDQDDQWDPNKIKVVYTYLQQNRSVDVAIHDLAFCDKNLVPTGETKVKRLSGFHNLSRDYVTGMATAVNKKFLNLCLPIPDQYVSHDAWVHLCAYYTNKKSILPEVLALYRRHESNATTDLLINHPNKLPWMRVFCNLLHEKINLDFNHSIKRHILLIEWLKRHKQILNTEFGVKVWVVWRSIIQLHVKVLLLQFLNLIRPHAILNK